MVKPVMRKCQGCGKVFDRLELLKITLSEGKLYLNPSSKILGRSVYVCENINCVKNIIKKKKIYSGLKFKNFEEVSLIEKKLTDIMQTVR